MKRILLIVDYFGRWPEWIDLFLLSCAHNASIDWLIHTDCPLPAVQPDNVRFVPMSFDDYCQYACDRLDVQFSPFRCEPGMPPSPLYTNLCDLRPCYGDLHAEAIAGYDYFGWCDVDVIFGNLRRFLTCEVMDKNLVTFSSDLCSGHFTLLKNDAHMVRVYRDIPQWRARISGRMGYTPWEDCLDEAWLSRLCSPPETPFRSEALALGVPAEHIDRHRNHHAFIREWVTPFVPWPWVDDQRVHPEVWFWQDGEVTNWRDGSRPFPYLHFMNFKEQRYVAPALYGLQGTWGKQLHVEPSVVKADVIRIDRDGFTGLSQAMAAADHRQLHQCLELARQTPTEGLTTRRAMELLQPAGVQMQQGRLLDRAGVFPAIHREALWQELSGQGA